MRRRSAVVAIIVGLVLFGTAVAQPVKAQVGRSLLSAEFEQRLQASPEDRSDPGQWRPWPWAELAPIAELHFPALDETRIVVDSASGEALAWGVGHMTQTAAPGEPGVSVVAGHRDGTFAVLGDVGEGDTVELRTLDGDTISYVIDERLVVDSRSVQLPIVHTGADELILTTCWPIQALTSGPERLLLRATRTGTATR